MTAMRRHVYIADESDAGRRFDVVLASVPAVSSRSLAARLIEDVDATLNERPASKSAKVEAGDVIEYELPDTPDATPGGEHIPLDIRYEDDHLIVLSKQTGLVCHPAAGHESGTLVNALVAHCGLDHLGTLQGPERPGIVHRLDKDTSGLMLAAKDDETQALLQDAIRIRSVDRRYLTLVHGNIAPATGLIDAPIARAPKMRMRMEVSDAPGARSSVTTFTVLARVDAARFDQGYTLLECKLYTGRTHQIRVHLSSIRHPCVGDQLYGARHERADLGLSRQFLHSYSLQLDHPLTGEHLAFLDPLPRDLREVWDGLQARKPRFTDAGREVYDRLAAARRARKETGS